MDNNNLVLLNTGEGTRFNINTGDFSAIDLTFSDAMIATDLSWNPHSYLYSSDHLPLNIEYNRVQKPNNHHPIEKWNLKSADWINFSNYIQDNLPIFESNNDVNLLANEFSTVIKNAADQHIRKFTSPPHHNAVPWWNHECSKAIKASKQAFYKLKRQYTPENKIAFKKLRARARYILKKSKKESWTQYISSINTTTPTSEVWNKIRKIKGSNSTYKITSLLQDNTIITNDIDIAESFANEYADASSDDNYEPTFLQHKRTTETQQAIQHIANENHPLNSLITLEELEDALNINKDTSPGPDNIPYAFLKHLPVNAKYFLLKLYNKIYSSHTFPESWPWPLSYQC